MLAACVCGHGLLILLWLALSASLACRVHQVEGTATDAAFPRRHLCVVWRGIDRFDLCFVGGGIVEDG